MFLWFLFYWVDIPEFIFWMNLWVLWKDTDVSISFTPRFFLCEALPMFQFVCTRCGKRCTNAGALATLMKTHTKQKVDSPPLLRFFKRDPAKKIAVELKPIKKKPQQIKLREKTRPKPLGPPQILRPSAPLITSKDVPPPPPKRLRSTCLSTWDLRHYVAPESIISSRLDKRSP